MEDHFTVHRWERDEPKLALLAVPPLDHELLGRVATFQYYLADQHTSGLLSLIPPELVHVTLCTLGWSSEIDDRMSRRFAAELAAHLDRYSALPARIGGCFAGRTGISMQAIQDDPFRLAMGTAASLAERAGARDGFRRARHSRHRDRYSSSGRIGTRHADCDGVTGLWDGL